MWHGVSPHQLPTHCAQGPEDSKPVACGFRGSQGGQAAVHYALVLDPCTANGHPLAARRWLILVFPKCSGDLPSKIANVLVTACGLLQKWCQENHPAPLSQMSGLSASSSGSCSLSRSPGIPSLGQNQTQEFSHFRYGCTLVVFLFGSSRCLHFKHMRMRWPQPCNRLYC